MTNGRQRRLSERVTHPSYLEGLQEKSISDLRAMRDECREAETEVSFERRLCQARLDILSAEINRREGGSDDDLVARLPEILGGDGGSRSDLPLPNRAPDFSVPRNADVPRRRVEEVVGEQTLARLSEIDLEELRKILDTLADYERTVSARRRSIHEVMDKVQAEIVRRYTSGEADPTAALS
ncbi:MAG: hypothetical protein M3174_02915 [Actinomycetota bacterium]|nr:hypothetical protein [Actinomycetota bacterium]